MVSGMTCKKIIITVVFLFFGVISVMPSRSQGNVIRYDFSKPTAFENGVTITGAGFDSIPIADITFGEIPTDKAFDGATDGQGIIINADPGEGVMILILIVTTINNPYQLN